MNPQERNPGQVPDDLFEETPAQPSAPPLTEEEDLFQEPATTPAPTLTKKATPAEQAKPTLEARRPGTNRPSRQERMLQALERLDVGGLGTVLENVGVDELALALLEAGAEVHARMAGAMDEEQATVFRLWLDLKDDKIPGGSVDAAQGKLIRVINQMC